MPEWVAEEEEREFHHSFTDEEIAGFVKAGRMAILVPPDELHAKCICGEEIDYISVYVPEGGAQENVVHHCHCKLTAEEFERVGRMNL
jgi:hypothetical protein